MYFAFFLTHRTILASLKNVCSWRFRADFSLLLQFKTLRVEEYQLALRNLDQHYQDFLRDSQDSQMFGAEDRMQVESSYNRASQHYTTMVSAAEKGDVSDPCSPSGKHLCSCSDDTFSFCFVFFTMKCLFAMWSQSF